MIINYNEEFFPSENGDSKEPLKECYKSIQKVVFIKILIMNLKSLKKK